MMLTMMVASSLLVPIVELFMSWILYNSADVVKFKSRGIRLLWQLYVSMRIKLFRLRMKVIF